MKPKLRFRYVNLYEKYVPKFFPEVERQFRGSEPQDPVEMRGVEFKAHYFGDYLLARKMIDAVELFKTSNNKTFKRFELPEKRKTLLETFNPDFAYLAEDYLPPQ